MDTRHSNRVLQLRAAILSRDPPTVQNPQTLGHSLRQ